MMCECGHAEKDHCKGEQQHDGYKFQMRSVRDPDPHTCKGKHCTAAICDCLHFSTTKV